MYNIELRDFRGFHDQASVEIRPITILIGENSAGKTSFMAGLNYLLDFSAGQTEPSFNKDPFQLGTFEQIAHHRGGRGGRARQFRLTMGQHISIGTRRRKFKDNVEIELTFTTSESQAAISMMNVKTDEGALRVKVDSREINVDYLRNGESIYSFETERELFGPQREHFVRYWRFLFRNLRFSFKRPGTEEQRETPSSEVEDSIMKIADLASHISYVMPHHVEAFSAIRTKPLRTYTPGIEIQDAEGSHVPFEIAKIYRSRNRDTWSSTKKSIEEFGEASEMFKELSIKSFGQSASDPFQIQFSSGGPKTNIVDLGYGTSQVLPILYSVTSASNGSIFLIQQPEVHLHPRAQAALGDFFIRNNLDSDKKFVIETHSDFIVDRIRYSVARGDISPQRISLLFFERKRLENQITQIELDENGDPISAPDSYRSFFVGEQMRLLGID